MKIKSLQMKNFRCFKDSEIKFNDRMTVIIGDNATGKTTMLYCINEYLSTKSANVNDVLGYVSLEVSNKKVEKYEIAEKILFFSIDRKTIFYAPIQGHGYNEFLFWLYDRKYDELLRREKNKEHQDKILRTVCKAVESCLPEYVDLRVEIVKDVRTMLLTSEQDKKDIDAKLLSSGYSSILSIVADLALRMVKGNPQMENPLESEAIVLIDEIDLSLHPSWQQRVLEDLPRVFPNAQFIVTTHSPLVLTTVEPENIVYLKRDDDDISVHYGEEMGIKTKGADAMRLMSYFMGVSSRPPEIKKQIRDYFLLIDAGKAESGKAKKGREKLEKTLGKDDPVFASADAAITRKKRFA